MPNPPRAGGGDGSKDGLEKTMAKTAGIVVFSGIAISILKTLNPFNNSSKPTMEPPLDESAQSEKTLAQPAPPCCRSSQRPLPEPPFQIPVSITSASVQQIVVESKGKTVEIVKGDTLWGLSTKYGVSIQAIKEANGLKSDTIYAGKKLIIPASQ